LNDPELTAKKFIKNRSYRTNRTYIFYKTGDLGRWLPDGNLDFLGRSDTQVKVRGMRIETSEIENQLMKRNDVKEVVVLAREGQGGHGGHGGEKYLCAYVVRVGECTGADLKEYLSVRLPSYMIPGYFIFIDAVPLFPNGKINRKALPDPGILGEGVMGNPVPRNWVEERLAEIWASVLRAAGPEAMGIDANFFELGGNSLKAAQMAARIHRAFQVRLPLAEIFINPTIRGVAAAISRAGKTFFAEIETVEKKEFYRLSYNQRRLWIVSQLEPESAAYNIPGNIALSHMVDEDSIKKIIYRIAARHESMRTSFRTISETPVQRVEQEVVIPFERIDISSLDGAGKSLRLQEIIDKEQGKPFDLSRAPLFRVLFIRCAEEESYLVFTMHHIISDGLSMEILKKEFMSLYDAFIRGVPDAAGLEPVTLQYKDFAEWQSKQLQDTAVKERSHRFWQKVLQKDLHAVALPAISRLDDGSRQGASYRCVIHKEVKDRLNRLAQADNTSLFTVLLGLFNILLSRVSGQEDILVGIPVSGREHISLQNIVGFFINTVILETHVDDNMIFNEFLGKENTNLLEVLQHQGYPMELVLDDLNMKFPPVNVFFNMLNLDPGLLEKELDSLESFHLDESVEVKFDLMVYITEYKNGIEILCNYKRRMFRTEAIASIMERYLKVVDFFTANPEKRILDYKQAEPVREKRSFKRN
jgi:acyl carrier protein